MLEQFFEIHSRLVRSVETRFKRFLFARVDWKTRLFALVGPRGVGKTTMLLQRIRETDVGPEECLYLSADNIRVQTLGLYDVASEFFRSGGRALFVDEVHKYRGWAQEVKNIYDSFPRARLGVSGSSSLDILAGRTDLSRRLVVYRLPGLSFREFLTLETGAEFACCSLPEILAGHTRLARAAVEQAGGAILRRFGEYLACGYYPFYLEGRELFSVKLGNVVEKVVSDDIPSVFGVRPSSVPVLRKLIHLVATSQPFSPNIERMSAALQTSKEFVYNYLEYLRKAGLFAFLASAEQGYRSIRKPHKIYLDNPNLFRAVLDDIETRAHAGAIRESFFLNQVGHATALTADRVLDFRTADGQGFEVGGRSKSNQQVRSSEDGWIAADGIETGAGRRIPLWLFGFLY